MAEELTSPRRSASAGRPRVMVVAVVASLATFIAFLDATIVNIAFPSIHAGFPAWSMDSLSWVMNAYNILFAALLMPAGRYADRFGRKAMFTAGLIVFVVASLLCALAPGAGLLIVLRGVQAVGAAMIVPSSLALLLAAFPESRRGVAVSLFAATGGLAAGIGPALGGFLIEVWDWRVVFAVNVPIGLVAAIVAWVWLTEAKDEAATAWPDIVSIVCSVAGFGLLALGIVKGHDWGWADWHTVGSLCAGIVLVLIVAQRCRTHPAPLIEATILTDRTVAAANASTFVFAVAFYGYLLANVLFLTSLWHYSTVRAGLALTPAPLLSTLVARPAGILYDRFGGRYIAAAGAVLVALGLTWYVRFVHVQPGFLTDFLPGAALSGLGVGMLFASLSAAAVQGVAGARFATATAFSSGLRQLGAVLGIAACVSYLGAHGANRLGSFQVLWEGAAIVTVVAGAVALALRPPSRPRESEPSETTESTRIG
ncbi:MFS transporter [Nocardia alni]|uniref:MFS transporter n=1 Tax=Nocardia alni TaxID=2815723 RepID=UPI0027E0FBE9|nr:MFS transporter [Nocardia alni]